MDFKAAMKAVMRQDPDIIMCRQIRDRATARPCHPTALERVLAGEVSVADAMQMLMFLPEC
jgi:type II secretory ATPase GspE/PulE/Tfp pilus assembly ATPase PilB-like protein